MMKLDEAIKHAKNTIERMKHDGTCDSCRHEHKQLLAWMEELKAYEDTGLTPEEVTVSRWIPVTERLPEDDATVLTYKNGIVEVQKYEKRRNGWICKGWFWSLANVTHWMPLPEPPKEANRND